MLTNHFSETIYSKGLLGFHFWTFLKMSKTHKNFTIFCEKYRSSNIFLFNLVYRNTFRSLRSRFASHPKRICDQCAADLHRTRNAFVTNVQPICIAPETHL
jgi:hypothetical protein